MKVNNETKKAYILHTFDNGKVALCKILNVYDSKDDANDNLLDLLSGDIQETELLKEYSKKDIL